MVKQANKERRQAVRAERVMSIEYRLVKRSGKRVEKSVWHLSTTENMSISGVAFLAEEDLKIDDVLHVRVVMSGVLDIFDGEAKVIRIDQGKGSKYPSVAVKFMGTEKKVRAAKTYDRKEVGKKTKKRA